MQVLLRNDLGEKKLILLKNKTRTKTNKKIAIKEVVKSLKQKILLLSIEKSKMGKECVKQEKNQQPNERKLYAMLVKK